jgi:hypothetical protein
MIPNRIVHSSIIFVLIVFAAISDSFAQKKWYRGNTHTHTTYSDGKFSPTAVAELYKKEGYHFLFITDHGKVAPIDESMLSDSEFLCIRGEESESYHHLSCLNIPQTIFSVFPPVVIDSTLKQGGFLMVNHPMRGNHEVYARDVWDIDELNHIEIYNSKSEKDGYHDNQALWDTLLTSGKLFYGVAADDFHDTKHLAKGWIMVKANALHKDSIIKAIKTGDFYSSTGVNFSKIEVNNSIIEINAPNATKINFIGNNKTVLQTNNSEIASYKITGDEGYIRVEASNKNGEKAWTQPLFWNKTFQGTKADTTIAKEICEGEGNYMKEGVYYETKESITGNDSIVRIHLSLIPKPGILKQSIFSISLGDTLLLNPVYDFDNYLWNTGDTVKSISIYGNKTGDFKYWLQVKNDRCTFTDTVLVKVFEPVGIDNINPNNKLSVFPNPAKDYIVLNDEGNSAKSTFILYSTNGTVFNSGEFTGSISLDINGLTQGIYFIQIINNKGVKNFKLYVVI